MHLEKLQEYSLFLLLLIIIGMQTFFYNSYIYKE